MKTHSVNFTAWEVLQPDGAGITDEHLAYFSTSAEAEKYKEQFKDQWPRRVRKVTINKSWIVCDDVEEIDQLKLENKRATALAKLTEDERKLLGLE